MHWARKRKTAGTVGVAVLLGTLLSGCVTRSGGPLIVVFPGADKTFDQYRADDRACRQIAQQGAGSAAPQAAGRPSEDPAGASDQRAAAIGTAAGLLVGRIAGDDPRFLGNAANPSRRDGAYLQCMFGKGHLVPAASQLPAPTPTPYPPPPRGALPAPPPGFYPLPPADFSGPPPPG